MNKQFWNNMDNNRHSIELTANIMKFYFFATAHFLFFNFSATAQNTLSFFLPHTKPSRKKNERVFSPTLLKAVFNFERQHLSSPSIF